MENVLLVGEDSALLNARANALARTGAKVTCCRVAELDLHLWNETYDLVVLCHSLTSAVKRSLIVTEVYRRWPQARILQVVSGRERLSSGSEAATIVVGDKGEEGELLEVSLQLLGKSQQDKWRPLSSQPEKLRLAS